MNPEASHTHGNTDDGPVRLGALESQVMDLLWDGAPMTVRQIITQLPAEPAYTTIATVLANLRKKNLVCTGKDGHTTLYGACVRREEHTARIMKHALDSSGDRQASILHFVESMAEDDQELLRQYLLRQESP